MSTAPEGPTLGGVGANNRRTRRFREMQAALPAAVQRIVEAAYRKFLENPNHQSLHRKELHDTHRGELMTRIVATPARELVCQSHPKVSSNLRSRRRHECVVLDRFSF